jgi:hypothetical protein
MSRQAQQAHWYLRRQQMLNVWNHGSGGDFDTAENVLRKRTLRTDRLRQKLERDREDSTEFTKII